MDQAETPRPNNQERNLATPRVRRSAGGRMQPYFSASKFADAIEDRRTKRHRWCRRWPVGGFAGAIVILTSSCAERAGEDSSVTAVETRGGPEPPRQGERDPEGEALAPWQPDDAPPRQQHDPDAIDLTIVVWIVVLGPPRRLRRARPLGRRADRRPGHPQRRRPEPDRPGVRPPALRPARSEAPSAAPSPA